MHFCCAIIVLLTLQFAASAQTLTAAEAIKRIQQRYAPANSVDTIKAGDGATPVTGIATTFLDTMDVLREANRRGANLVITHEPTFYNHRDDPALFINDPVYREKLAFIQEHHMVVFRLHDIVHMVAPDRIATGLIQELGWQAFVKGPDPYRFTIPKTSVLDLSRE